MNCLYCNKEIIKRKQAKYCNTTCRHSDWRRKRNQTVINSEKRNQTVITADKVDKGVVITEDLKDKGVRNFSGYNVSAKMEWCKKHEAWKSTCRCILELGHD